MSEERFIKFGHVGKMMLTIEEFQQKFAVSEHAKPDAKSKAVPLVPPFLVPPKPEPALEWKSKENLDRDRQDRGQQSDRDRQFDPDRRDRDRREDRDRDRDRDKDRDRDRDRDRDVQLDPDRGRDRERGGNRDRDGDRGRI